MKYRAGAPAFLWNSKQSTIQARSLPSFIKITSDVKKSTITSPLGEEGSKQEPSKVSQVPKEFSIP